MIARPFDTSFNPFYDWKLTMLFRVLLTVTVVLFLRGYAQAAPIQLAVSSGTYQSGSSLSLDVLLPDDINDLGAYEIQIVLTGDDPTAGIDFGFDVGATQAANSHYVFATTDFFFDTVLPLSTTSQILVLSDLTLAPGVDVTAGVNDRVAQVVVEIAAGYTGSLTFTVDPVSLILDTSDGNEVTEIAAIRADTAALAPTRLVVAIPEPAAIPTIAIIMLIGLFRDRQCQANPTS